MWLIPWWSRVLEQAPRGSLHAGLGTAGSEGQVAPLLASGLVMVHSSRLWSLSVLEQTAVPAAACALRSEALAHRAHIAYRQLPVL